MAKSLKTKRKIELAEALAALNSTDIGRAVNTLLETHREYDKKAYAELMMMDWKEKAGHASPDENETRRAQIHDRIETRAKVRRFLEAVKAWVIDYDAEQMVKAMRGRL